MKNVNELIRETELYKRLDKELETNFERGKLYINVYGENICNLVLNVFVTDMIEAGYEDVTYDWQYNKAEKVESYEAKDYITINVNWNVL